MKKIISTIFMLSTLIMPGCTWLPSCDCPHDHSGNHAHKHPAATPVPADTATVLKISSIKEFEEKVIASTKPVIVDFSAQWCGPCQSMKPIVQELAQELGSHYTFVDVNVDAAQDVARAYNIQGIPTFTFFKDGKEVISEQERIVGAIEKNTLKAALEKYLG